GPMAARAQRVARSEHATRVRIVTVAARHTSPIHAALKERPGHVDLVQDLAVRVVQVLAQQRELVIVEERTIMRILRSRAAAARMTPCAVEYFSGAIGLAKVDEQPRGLRVVGTLRAIARSRGGPFDVRRARAVTRLTPDVDGRPRRPIRVR